MADCLNPSQLSPWGGLKRKCLNCRKIEKNNFVGIRFLVVCLKMTLKSGFEGFEEFEGFEGFEGRVRFF
jgi:hypothetical protein